jgi:hypothetical protein
MRGDGASKRRAMSYRELCGASSSPGPQFRSFGSYLFKIQSLPVHGLLTILLTTMIALLVFFIATTDHPYSGSNAIEPLAYEIVLRYLQDYN